MTAGGREGAWAKRIVAMLALAAVVLPGMVRAEPAAPPRFQAMVERPLFSPTRRPPPPPAPAEPVEDPVAPVPEPPPGVSLSGVVFASGGGVALLNRPGDAAPVRVALGGRVDGWTLAEIRPRAVVLRRDGRSVTVDLPAAR